MWMQMRMLRMQRSGRSLSTACRRSCATGCAYTAPSTHPSEQSSHHGRVCSLDVTLACVVRQRLPAPLAMRTCVDSSALVPSPFPLLAGTTRSTCGPCGCTPAATAAWTTAGALQQSCPSGHMQTGCRRLPSEGAVEQAHHAGSSAKAGCPACLYPRRRQFQHASRQFIACCKQLSGGHLLLRAPVSGGRVSPASVSNGAGRRSGGLCQHVTTGRFRALSRLGLRAPAVRAGSPHKGSCIRRGGPDIKCTAAEITGEGCVRCGSHPSHFMCL